MILAWVVLAPCAFLFKRYPKNAFGIDLTKTKVFKQVAGLPMFPEDFGGFPLSFFLHASFMTMAVIFTIAGGSIALSRFDGRVLAGHGGIGLTVILLAIWQPLPAYWCRRAHGHPSRVYFDFIHKLGGRTLLFLGPVNVLLGLFNYWTLWDPCRFPIFLAIVAIIDVTVVGVALTLECKKEKRMM